MAVMENCCCCRVRTACLIFGSLYLIGAIFTIGSDGSSIVTEMRKTPEEQNHEYDDLLAAYQYVGIESTREQIVNFLNIDFYVTFVDLFLSMCMVIIASLLIFGVHKAKSRFLVPSLVFFPLDTLVRIIFVAVHVENLGFLHPLAITINVICICGIVFDFFIWLCVYSHRQQIKDQLVSHEEWEGSEKFAL